MVSIQTIVTWFSGSAASGTRLDQSVINIITADTGFEWLHYEQLIKPPQLAHSAKIELKAHSDAPSLQTVYWDNSGLFNDGTALRFENFENGVLPIW